MRASATLRAPADHSPQLGVRTRFGEAAEQEARRRRIDRGFELFVYGLAALMIGGGVLAFVLR